jgi:hypothetical protein
MNKDFVPYQPSVDMKELGFDEPCFAYYDNALQIRLCSFEKMSNKGFVSAPTFSQSFRFFREKYGDLLRYDWGEVPHFLMIQIEMAKGKTYEEAELACLKKLIEIANEK